MANVITKQTIIDNDRNVVVSVTAILDTSDMALDTILDVSALVPAATAASLDKIDYSISSQLALQIFWDADTDDNMLMLTGAHDICARQYGGLQNPKSAGWTGDVKMKTTGWASGIQTFTAIFQFIKQGVTA